MGRKVGKEGQWRDRGEGRIRKEREMVGERKGGKGKRKGCVMAVEEIDAPCL